MGTVSCSHQHEQTEAAVTWTIVHNLGTYAPVVDVYVDVSGSLQKILPKSVTVINNTTIEIVFSSARTGIASVR